MAITSDGKKVIFITDDGQVVIRDMKEKTNSEPIKIQGHPNTIYISPNNQYALLTEENKTHLKLTIVDIKLNKIAGERIILEGNCHHIAITLDGKYAFVTRLIEEFSHHVSQERICDIIDIEKQKVKADRFKKVENIMSIKMVPHSTSALVFNFGDEIFKLDISDINNIKVVGDPIKEGDKITIFPNGEKAFIGSSTGSSPLYILDMVHWKYSQFMKELVLSVNDSEFITFLDKEKLAVLTSGQCISFIDFEKPEVLKQIKLPLKIFSYDDNPIKVVQDGNFALIAGYYGYCLISVLDIKKQKLVGKPLQFSNSEGKMVLDFKFMIVPEEKKSEFLNFQNFDLDINFLN
jgi:hypothetical protein